MTEIEQRARALATQHLGREPEISACVNAMLTFAREREAEAIEKAAKVADFYDTLPHIPGALATAIRELNTPSEIGGEG